MGSSPQCRHKAAQASDTNSETWNRKTNAFSKMHWSSVSKGVLERWKLKARLRSVARQTYLYLFCGWKGFFRRSPNFEGDLNRFPDSSLPALRFCSFTSTSCRPLQLLGAMNHFHLQPEQLSHQQQGPHSSSACPNSGKHQDFPAHFLVRGCVPSCARRDCCIESNWSFQRERQKDRQASKNG